MALTSRCSARSTPGKPARPSTKPQSPDTMRPSISETYTAAEMTLPQLLHWPSSMRRRSTV